MRKSASKMIVLAGAVMSSGAAIAASSITGPIYIGDRSVNPEQETYAYLAATERERVLGFVGPPRNVGIVSDSAEETTIGYRPLVVILENGLWSIQLAER